MLKYEPLQNASEDACPQSFIERLPKSRVKIGYIFPHWTLGGVSRGVITLAQYQPKNVEFSGVAIFSVGYFDEIGMYKAKIPIWYGGKEKHGFNINTAKSHRDACQTVIDKSDLIIFWGFGSDFPEFKQLDWKNKPVVVSVHGTCSNAKLLVDTIGKYATHYRAVSKAASKVWGNKSVHVTYNGVDLNRLIPTLSSLELKSKWGIKDNHKVITHLGRLNTDKNPVALAEAISMLDDEYIALYVGSSHNQEITYDKIKSILGDRAIFTGSVTDIGNVFQISDCVVMTTPNEGHCQVLNEAWGFGVKVASTRVGAIPELEEKYGKLVEPINSDFTSLSLASTIEKCTLSDNLEVVNRAKNMINKNFTIASTAVEFEKFAVDVVEKHEKSRGNNFSITMTASRPDLFKDAIRQAVSIFPNYKEIIIAISPDMPQEAYDYINTIPRSKIVSGANSIMHAGKALFDTYDLCTGDWIVNVDDDDMWLKFKYNTLDSIDDDVAIISGGSTYFVYYENNYGPSTLFGSSVDNLSDLRENMIAMPGSFRIFRKSAWDNIKEYVKECVPDYMYYNDYMLLLCILYFGYKMKSVNEIWGVSRTYHKKDPSDVPKWCDVYDDIISKIESKKTDMLKQI